MPVELYFEVYFVFTTAFAFIAFTVKFILTRFRVVPLAIIPLRNIDTPRITPDIPLLDEDEHNRPFNSGEETRAVYLWLYLYFLASYFC